MNKKLERVLHFIGGGIAYSYIDKMVTYRNEAAEAVLQAERDHKLEMLNNNVNILTKMFSDHVTIIKECAKAFGDINKVFFDIDQTLSQLNEIKNSGNNILNKIKEMEVYTDWNLESTYKDNLELLRIVDEMIKKIDGETGNNFVSGLSDFYQFLENLSLLQHLVLLDIILFLIVIVTIINIFSALFGNEIIKYFNLENRFPKLSVFFKVRSTLQKYYLIWSVFVLMFVCIFAIIINTVSLYLTLT